MHVCEYIVPSQEGIVIEEENVISYYNREVRYLLRLSLEGNRRFLEVAGFKTRNNKRRINNKRKVKFVELIGMGKEDEKARKEITEELQKIYGKLSVLFWSLP